MFNSDYYVVVYQRVIVLGFPHVPHLYPWGR